MVKPKRHQKTEGKGGKRQKGMSDAKDTSAAANCICPPDLPALIWSRILSDYQPYNYPILLCFSAVSRFFLRDVIPAVKRLAIYHTREMHVSPLHRFQSVEKADILCLVRNVPSRDALISRPNQEFDVEASRRIVNFLSRLSSLKRAFIGGSGENAPYHIYHSYRYSYKEDVCITDGHREAYRELIRSICTSYRMGALPPNLDLRDSLWWTSFCDYDSEIYEVYDDEDHEACDTCKDVCNSFPLEYVTSLASATLSQAAALCLSDEERLYIIERRRGGKEYLQSPHTLMKLIKRQGFLGCFRRPLSREEQSLKEDDEDYGLASSIHLRTERLNYIKLVSQYGCDWSPIDNATFRRLTSGHLDEWLVFNEDGPEAMFMTQKDFDFLHGLGVPIKAAGYVAVPDEWDVSNEESNEDEN